MKLYNLFVNKYFSNVDISKIDDAKIIEFFDFFGLYRYELIKYIDNIILNNKENKNIKENKTIKLMFGCCNSFLNIISWKERLNVAINVDDINNNSKCLPYMYHFTTIKIIEFLQDKISFDEKINYVDNYFNDSKNDEIIEFTETFPISKIFSNKITLNNELAITKKKIIHELLRTKYSDEIYNEKNSKFIDYKLDYNSHYELYKSDEKKYMEMLSYNDFIDCEILNSYDHDNFEFLNNFNDEVKVFLKNKIFFNSNPVFQKKENVSISSLDNYIDIMYFIHNPPTFLRLKNIKYYPDYIKLMDEYVSEFNFDFSKINYLNAKLKVELEYI